MNLSTSLPQHIAIIMDGNGRWAKSKSLPKNIGHREGSKVAETIAKECQRLGVKYLTLYAFSSENWNRSEDEVSWLMSLLHDYLRNNVNKLVKSGMRVSFIGDRTRLPKDLVAVMNEVEASSINNDFHLILAISYSGRDEIRNAAAKMCEQALKLQAMPEDNYFDQLISTNKIGVPDPDLLIRTSGEYRLSNFLLWQVAYSELLFVEKLWPDFTELDLQQAILEFNKRDRRYGK